MEPVENEYGMEYVHTEVRALRIFRTDGKWLVEYRRKPRSILYFWDYFWWYDDGTYVNYNDAKQRVDYLREVGYTSKVQFMKVKTFTID